MSSIDLVDKNCVPTGVEAIDEKTRGIPKGSVVSFIATPDTAGRLFLYHLAHTGRTTYITTYRPETILKQDLENFPKSTQGDIRLVDSHQRDKKAHELIQQEYSRAIKNEVQNVIVDTMSAVSFEKDPATYIRKIHESVRESNIVTYLYFVRNGIEDLSNAEKEIVSSSDVVFKLQEAEKGDNFYSQLLITKLAGKETPDEIIHLNYTETVNIDPATKH